MDTNKRILINMAINNTETEAIAKEMEIYAFKSKIIKRYKFYEEIHKTIEEEEINEMEKKIRTSEV